MKEIIPRVKGNRNPKPLPSSQREKAEGWEGWEGEVVVRGR
jgi:hypothetical protein